MLEKLKLINDNLLEKNKNNVIEYKKFFLIKEILNKDNPFLNMNIEYAYSILRDLNVEEKHLKKVYEDLLNIN